MLYYFIWKSHWVGGGETLCNSIGAALSTAVPPAGPAPCQPQGVLVFCCQLCWEHRFYLPIPGISLALKNVFLALWRLILCGFGLINLCLWDAFNLLIPLLYLTSTFCCRWLQVALPRQRSCPAEKSHMENGPGFVCVSMRSQLTAVNLWPRWDATSRSTLVLGAFCVREVRWYRHASY